MVKNRNTSFFKVRVNGQVQSYIHLSIFFSSLVPFTYILKQSDDANNLIQDLVKPKQWHHLCIGMDAGAGLRTVYGALVKGQQNEEEID